MNQLRFHFGNRTRNFFGFNIGTERTPGVCVSVIRFSPVSAPVVLAVAWIGLCGPRQIQAFGGQADISEQPIEELMKMKVTLATRTERPYFESAAAISVITQDDIRRSGAVSIADALRLVPGMDVARVDASQWAISARGFNDVFANKLLVLQDGRSVYTPLFSGVYWDVQGAMLEDIDRIEVVRGPGAAQWGANAVNGVINIITRSAKDTRGLLISGGGGTEERGFGAVRYGDKLGQDAYVRVYGMYFNKDDSALPNGNSSDDAWQLGRGGFRADWDVSPQNLLTFQGDAYRGSISQVIGFYDTNAPPFYAGTAHKEVEVRGGNLLGRFTHTFSSESDLRVQLYYDRTERDTFVFDEKRNTFDADVQYHFPIRERNDVVVGVGYRVTSDEVGNTETVALNPDSRTTHVFSAFAQDEITLVEDRLKVTLGSKFEHNDYTGFEAQPSARLAWTPPTSKKQIVWASVSRAVRTPARAEDDLKLNQVVPPGALFSNSPPAVVSIYGNRHFQSEELLASEIGYRIQPHANFSFDVTAFYNIYDDLRSIEMGPSPTQPPTAPPPPPDFFVVENAGNKLYGETYGIEAAANCQIAKWWRVQPSYSLLQMELHTRSSSTDSNSENDEGRNPQQQFVLRSSMDLTMLCTGDTLVTSPDRHSFSLDSALRYVDALPALNISGYVELDVRLGWRYKNWEVALVGQNLLDNQHPEFKPSFTNTRVTEVERGVYGKVTVRF
jgi:iron complex outermembrane receptor protein